MNNRPIDNRPIVKLLQSPFGDRCFIRDDVAEKIIKSAGVSFSCGADADHFTEGDFCYFGTTSYKHRGNSSIYKAKLAIHPVPYAFEDADGYNFLVAAISGSYGMNGLQQGVKYTFSNFVRKQLHLGAEYFLTSMSAAK
jgi:hypothetical protein